MEDLKGSYQYIYSNALIVKCHLLHSTLLPFSDLCNSFSIALTACSDLKFYSDFDKIDLNHLID